MPLPELLMAIPSWFKEMVVCLQVGPGAQLSGAPAGAPGSDKERGVRDHTQSPAPWGTSPSKSHRHI